MSGDNRNAVIWGAGGFVGGELLRLLLGHPHFRLAAVLSSTHEGRPVSDVQPALTGLTDLRFASAGTWNWQQFAEGSWTLFTCLGHGETMTQLPPLLQRFKSADLRVVDLSGDFRLESADLYQRYYGRIHRAPQSLAQFVYGLPELNQTQIAASRLVANPGCFATGAQLAFLPLAAHGLPVRALAVDGKTGSSGAGVKPTATTHHPLRSNNFRAYKMMIHQHTPEIVNGWLAAGGDRSTEISFVPQMAPLVRGIFTTAHVFFQEPFPPRRICRLFQDYYASAPMVRVLEESPALSQVWGTNRCDLSITVEGRLGVICSAIDNLIRGAAGQAVQNANIMHGWDPSTGLCTPPPQPV